MVKSEFLLKPCLNFTRSSFMKSVSCDYYYVIDNCVIPAFRLIYSAKTTRRMEHFSFMSTTTITNVVRSGLCIIEHITENQPIFTNNSSTDGLYGCISFEWSTQETLLLWRASIVVILHFSKYSSVHRKYVVIKGCKM